MVSTSNNSRPRRRGVLVIVIAMVIALTLWHGQKHVNQTLPSSIAEPHPTASQGAMAKNSSVRALTNASIITPISGAASPTTNRVQQMQEDLSVLNDVDINFYGRLEDQFGNGVGNADVKFEVSINNGRDVGVQRGTVAADRNGFFRISGYRGKSLSTVPVKFGYALASLNGGGIYSYLWPESQRTHFDPNNPTIIKMWKLQGAEPLVAINKAYKLAFTSAAIIFDLVSGQIVPTGGDLKISLNRPSGEISERHPQPWSIDVETVGGGFIETSSQECQVTYSAPEHGYQAHGTFANNNGIGSVSKVLFVKSRDGQVYSKLYVSFDINETPDGYMYVKFRGIANTNASRNWEGDPNTLKMAGR